MTINVSVHIGNMLGSQLFKVKEANLQQMVMLSHYESFHCLSERDGFLGTSLTDMEES